MKTAPKLQAFILQLAEKHGVAIQQPGAHLRLELDAGAPWARLIIEHLGASRIAIAHQLHLFNDWVADPELVLWTEDEVGWAPIEVNQVQGGWQSYAELDPNGDLEVFPDPQGQAALADLAEAVAAHLTAQGWLAHGRRLSDSFWPLADDEPSGRMAGCQSTNHTHCYGELWQCAACGKTVCYAEGTDDHPELCDDCWVKHQAPQAVFNEEADDVPF